MARLSARDLSALLRVVEGLYDGLLDARTLGERVVASLRTLISGEAVTYSDLNLAEAKADEVSDPPIFMTPAVIAIFSRYMHENALVAHFAKTGDGRARKISDLMTRTELHRTGLYNEYVRPFSGTEYQMAIAIRAHRSRVVGVSTARSRRDYSERDRLLLDMLRPHVQRIAGLTSLVEQLAEGVTSLSGIETGYAHGLAALDRAGRARFMTTGARRLLEAHFGRVRARDRLPGLVRRWVLANARGLHDGEVPCAIEPLVARREARTLTIWHRPTADGHVVLMEERTEERLPPHVARWGLTPREAEVLAWVAEGKTSSETAVILGTRPRTIDKHLERIFMKLGVENRTAAAALFVRRPVAVE